MPVHNHGPEEGAGLFCKEFRLPDGTLLGACLVHYAYTRSCSDKECPRFFADHEWGKKRAQRAGWFIQWNDDVWCPDHIPNWVAKWRAKKIEEKD